MPKNQARRDGRQASVLLGLGTIGGLLIGSLIFLAGLTVGSLSAISAGNLNQATKFARLATPGASTVSTLTLHQVPFIEAWIKGLRLIGEAEHLKQLAGEIFLTTETENDHKGIIDLNKAQTLAHELLTQLNSLSENIDNSLILKTYKEKYQLHEIISELEASTTILDYLVSKDQRWVVLLQNSDELRSSGGFAGSYALITIEKGVVLPPVIEDIYDADGQIQKYPEPPTGVKEYLSGGKGWHIQDVNWSADYLESSKNIIEFFKLANKGDFEGVITINTPFVEDLLAITGEVAVKDYETTVNRENLSQVLRSSRDTFFPGSLQKKHLLSLVFNQIQLALSRNLRDKLPSVISMIKSNINNKQLLAYAKDEEVEKSFQRMGASGELMADGESEYVYLLESNVGINKANRGISRDYYLDWKSNSINISVKFQNQNQPKTQAEVVLIKSEKRDEASHNGYANYQRLLVPESWTVKDIFYKGEAIDGYDISSLTLENGIKLKQIGFIITLSEQSEAKLEIKLGKPASNQTQLVLQKQPGIRSIPLTITSPIGEKYFDLNKDLRISLPQLVLE